MSGRKCNDGLIGIHQSVLRGDCDGAADPANQMPSYFKQAQAQGSYLSIILNQ